MKRRRAVSSVTRSGGMSSFVIDGVPVYARVWSTQQAARKSRWSCRGRTPGRLRRGAPCRSTHRLATTAALRSAASALDSRHVTISPCGLSSTSIAVGCQLNQPALDPLGAGRKWPRARGLPRRPAAGPNAWRPTSSAPTLCRRMRIECAPGAARHRPGPQPSFLRADLGRCAKLGTWRRKSAR